MYEGLFRKFQRDYRPLSAHLQRSVAGPIVSRVRHMAVEELDRSTAAIVRSLVDEARVEGPKLQGTEHGRSGQREGDWRPGPDASTRLATNRHFVAVEVTGEIDLLQHWPDAASTSLVPIDEFADDPYEPDEPYDEATAVVRHHRRQAQERWFIGIRDTEPFRRGLYTFVDLTDDDEQAVVDRRLDPRAMIDAERAAIEPIVEAIYEQTRLYFDNDLPAYLTAVVDDRKRAVQARSAVRKNLTWPDAWKFDPPKVATTPMPADETPGEEASTEDAVPLAHRGRLDPASFDDVLRTIRVWADSVERHPRAYRNLSEDRLSDLLVGTLNAALPGASREVYTRGGKSDIFIRADVLREGLGPAKIFICENKWWAGPAAATKALRQLLGYLETKDTAAVLGFFVKSAASADVRKAAEKSLAGTAGFRGRVAGPVAGWPILQFEDQGRRVDVCVAFVDLPDRD